MEIIVKQVTTPQRALNAARLTVHKPSVEKEPTTQWWYNMLKAEHSPIRLVEFDIQFLGIPRFVADHLVRYGVGCEPFMGTQRPDRNSNVPKDRSELSQTEPTDLQLSLNAATLIWIARQRLCTQASAETRAVIRELKNKIAEIDPFLAAFMVPNCVYRGLCPEPNSCGLDKTENFSHMRLIYSKQPLCLSAL